MLVEQALCKHAHLSKFEGASNFDLAFCWRFICFVFVCVCFVCFFLGEQGRGMMNERVGADTVSKMFRVCSQVHVLVGPFQPGIFYESC